MTFVHLIVLSVTVGILYLAIADRLRAFGARFRHESAELGTELLADENVPPELKRTIESLLGDVPYSRIAWTFAACVIPGTISILIKSSGSRPFVDTAAPYFPKWDAFTDAVVLASVCNSPAAAAILGLQLAAMSFLVSAQMLVELLAEHFGKSAGSQSVGRDAAANSR